MPVHGIEIQLDRARNVFHQGEHVSGRLVLDNKYELRHEGVHVSLEGFVDISANFKRINLLLDAFNGTTRTLPLAEVTYELLKPGRLTPGKTIVPFKILIDGSVDTPTLYETYHGVYISIQYFVKCRIRRPLFFKDLVEARELVLEYDPLPIGAPARVAHPLEFAITPASLSCAVPALGRRPPTIPNFKISGKLDSVVCHLDEPITGEFIIESCQAPIRSIELQLVRVETLGGAGLAPPLAKAASASASVSAASSTGAARLGATRRASDEQSNARATVENAPFSREATEVQNIQIGDGDLMRNIPISIYMVLPRLFTCPTLVASTFRLEFELNLVIIFVDNHLISENFPIKLLRSTLQPICNTI